MSATTSSQPPPQPHEGDPPVSPALEGPSGHHPQQDHAAGGGGGGGSSGGGSSGGGGGDLTSPPHSSAQHDPSSSSQDQTQQQHHQQQHQQQHQQLQQQQQQAAAMGGFNPAAGRRVTIGGIQGSAAANAFDRRGSLASASGFNMDEFFGNRRGSLGFDMGMEAFFGSGGPGGMMRRGSMDSTTAVLDQAIFDLQTKRFSMAMGAGAAGGGAPGGAPPPDFSTSQTNLTSMGSMGSLGGSLGLGPASYNPNNFAVPPGLPPSSAGSIAARQQQLQEQQRDLERRQKELEVARQQLIASMQERSYAHGGGAMGAGVGGPQPGGAPPNPPYPPQSFGGGPYPSSGSMGWGSAGGYRRSSLDLSGRGLDYSHRGGPSLDLPQHRGTMDFSSRGIPLDHSQRSGLGVGHPLDQSHRSSGSSTASQWWVCQVCNAKAFASHEEAMAHEAVCQDVPRVGMSNRRNDSLAFSEASHNVNHHRESIGTMGTMDSSSHSAYEPVYSTGPFADMEHPMPLAMPSDKDWLTPLHCFVRRHCVEVFTASEYDVATPSKGKRKPITVGQVGIRCPHCHSNDPDAHAKARERGSVYFPTTIASIYNATMNLLQRHLHSCTSVPEHIMRRYETLKADDARSGTSKKYWIQSAHSLGLVDTPMGIRYSALVQPPPQALTSPQEGDMYVRRNSNDFFSSSSNAGIKEVSMSERKVPASPHSSRAMGHDGAGMMTGGEDYVHAAGPLVSINDKPYSTSFSYHLLSQMQPCNFTEADRLGKRKGLPQGFPGLACRHCFGGYGSGRFFPSSIKTLSDTSKTLNVLHNHMMRCRKCPAEVRELLEKLRGSHDDERAKMKFGSQKAFFARIWDRLHGKDSHSMDTSLHGSSPRPKGKRKAPPAASSSHAHMGHQQFPMSDDSMHRSRRGSTTGSLDSMVAAAAAASELPPLTAGPSSNTGALDALVQASDVKRQKTR